MRTNRSLRSTLVLAALCVTVLLALSSSAVWATARRQTTPTQPGAPATLVAEEAAATLPPVLIASDPADGATWHGGAITLTFDRALAAETAALVTIAPDLAGDVTIADARVVFTPSVAPAAGARYTLRVPAEATAADGTALGSDVAVSVVAASPLAVTSSQPTNGALEVGTTSQIVVVFNRPVVALVGVDDQAGLSAPLTIEPAVEGAGRWINTSVYVFQPALALDGGTDYRVTVAEVTDVEGVALAESYVFTFTTATPIVTSSAPTGIQVTPDTRVLVYFSQPMDPESTAAAFSFYQAGTGAPVAGDLGWMDEYSTLVYTPTLPLEFGARYVYEVAETAQPKSRNGTLRAGYSRQFTIVPLPAVQSVSPVDGAQEVSTDTSVVVRFNAPLSPTLVLENINVSPLLTTTRVFSYYSEYQSELQFSWFKEPNTQYTVTLGADIGDNYGNTLGEDYTFHFTTGDYPAYARLETERFTHFSAYTDTRLSLLYRNVAAVTVDLYRLPDDELFRLAGSNQWSIWDGYALPNAAAQQVWSRTYEAVEERNITMRQVVELTDEDDQPLPPGVYFIQVQQPPGATQNTGSDGSSSVIVLSKPNLTFKKSIGGESLVWLTDLETGQPVADQKVRFFSEGILVGEGVTGPDGTLQTRIEVDEEIRWAPTLAVAGEPGDPNYALVSSEWTTGISIWEFGLSGGWSLEEIQSYFYTDRPIYRPGQTVYWKGIMRALRDDVYVLPPAGQTVQVTLRNPMGEPVTVEEMTVGPTGTVDGEFHLADEALTGGYYLEGVIPLDTEGRTAYAGASFAVASYRKPEYEITVTPGAEQYVQGDTVRITVQANYFSGGPLAGAPVTWRVISNPHTFNWDNAPRGRYFSFTPFDPEQTVYDPYGGSYYLGLIHEGTGTTGPDGSFVIEVPADIAKVAQSQDWLFDVTVQSPTNQFVSGSAAVPIHKAAYYIGISPAKYVGRVGEASAIDFVTVDPLGDPYGSREMKVIIYEYQWNSVYSRAADGIFRWETSIARTPVYTTTVHTGPDGTGQLSWTPTVAGQYQIAASGIDDAGNLTRSAAFIWISAVRPTDMVPWPRANNDRLELVADKSLYEPGDTARILVPSPFSGSVRALLTLERAGIVSAEVITLTGASQTIEIPIDETHIPNIFVGIVLAAGVDATNPTPAMRLGYVELKVDTGAKELVVDVTSDRNHVEPGATVAYTVTVTDQAGNPAPATEMSVAIVDRAVLALTYEAPHRLVDSFYYQRPLDVQTAALLTINLDRMSQQLSEGAKGGGGGGDGGMFDLRTEFPDIAYWRADLTTNASGVATFTVTLPDNLTTWRLTAQAVTSDTKVGDATYDVVAAKDLQVRPIAPRFFTGGDEASIGAAVLNTTANALTDGVLSLSISGATLVGQTETEVAFDLPAADQMRATWPIRVDQTATQVVITLTAVADATGGAARTLADGVRLTLPVARYSSPETVATAGVVPPSGVLEAIRLPTDATDQGELTVNIEASLAGGMVDGLGYLAHYPYECNEQTVSRFLPNLFTVRALHELGIQDPVLEAGLDEQIGTAVQRLITRQNQDGGWGYWPGDRSATFITGYVLWGLGTAADAGYTVPATTLQAAVDFIERTFAAPDQLQYSWQLNETAFLHFVLAEMGQGDPGRASTLYDVRERLGIYGKAFLAMALDDMRAGEHDSRADTLMDDLYGAAHFGATTVWWQEDSVDYRTLNTDTRSTAVVLAAFIRLDPEQPILPQAVRWLMETRQQGRWSNTQETAWSLIALTDWLALTGELQGDYSWSVSLNDAELGSGVVTPQNVTEKVTLRADVADLLRDEANALRFDRDGDQGRMYYTTYLNYYLDAEDIDARDRGIVVDRRFGSADAAEGEAITAAAVGDVISVTVTIIAPTDLFQVLVEVPIPAGVEPIDTSLATTSELMEAPTVEQVDETPVWWRSWVPSYSDIRDDKVALFATYLQAGTYEYTFMVQATIAGEYRVLPVYAEQMYFTDVWGRSTGAIFSVTE